MRRTKAGLSATGPAHPARLEDNQYSNASYGIGSTKSDYPGCTNMDAEAATIIITTDSLQGTTIYLPYSVNLTAETLNTNSEITWTLTDGNLPEGFTLLSSGTITGTSITPGTYTFTVTATSGTISTSKQFSITIADLYISIITTSLPDGKFGDEYSAKLEASTSVVTWSLLSGKLPTGLTLSSSGTISGTPTSAGIYSFKVKASNGSMADTQQYTITIAAAPVTVSITKTSLAGGTVGTAYSDTLTADVSGVTWSISSGTLPAGLTLNANTGVISGTPTTANTYTFTVRATSGTSYTSKQYTITIAAAPVTINITTSSLASGTVGTAYSDTLTADVSGVTWSVSSGSLPSGLRLNANTGVISGVPLSANTYTFTVRATSGTNYTSKQYTIRIVAATVMINITTSSLASGTVGTAYSDTLTADVSGVTWSVSSGSLPAGLTLNATTGIISGTPTTANTYTFTVRATSGTSYTNKQYTITIKAATPPTVTINITTSSLASGTVGTAYNDMLTADVSGVTWSVSSGSLPAGLMLNANTGVISGNPTTANTYTFTVRATSGTSYTNKQYTITITAATAPRITVNITTSSLAVGTVGKDYTDTLRSDVLGVTWSISSGTLPVGLTLDETTGVISGNPTSANSYTFTVRAAKDTSYATKQYIITIEPAPIETETIEITTPYLPNATVGQEYSATLTADKPNALWSATGLPSWLELSSAGILSGTPKDAGTFMFKITAEAGEAETSKSFTLTVNAATPSNENGGGTTIIDNSTNTTNNNTTINDNSTTDNSTTINDNSSTDNSTTITDNSNTTNNEETTNNNKTDNDNKSLFGGVSTSGGCNSGMGIFSLIFAAWFLRKR